MIMQTLCLVQNATSIDYILQSKPLECSHLLLQSGHLIWPQLYHPDSRHFANKLQVHWLNEQQEELKARNSVRAARYHLSALLVASMCFTLRSLVTLHHWKQHQATPTLYQTHPNQRGSTVCGVKITVQFYCGNYLVIINAYFIFIIFGLYKLYVCVVLKL